MNKITTSFKSLVLFLIITYIIFIIYNSSTIMLPLYAIDLGGTEFDAGLQSGLFFIFAVILRIYFGPLADRKGRKTPLLIGAFVFATSSLLFMFCSQVWHLTLARLYQSIALATYLASGSSLMADIAPKKSRGTYIGIYRLVITLALLTAPFTAMKIINNWGYDYWFTITFIGGLVAFGLLNLVKAPEIEQGSKLGSLDSIFTVLRNHKVLPVYMGIALASMCYGLAITFVSIYISNFTKLTNPGIYFIFFGISGAVANISAGYLSDKLGRSVVVWPANIMLALGIMILTLVPKGNEFILISAIIAGLGWSGGIAAFTAWLVDVADDKIRATALSLQDSIIDMAIAFGSLFFGILAMQIGMQYSFMWIGLVAIILTLFLMITSLKERI